MSIVLPLEKIEKVRDNPKRLVIYSKPKAGKTTLIAELPSCLLLDFEKGSDFVSATKLKVDSLAHLKEIGKAIIDAGRPYKRIAIDTTTALEEMCLPLAKKLYQNTPMGKNFDGDNVLKLPNGSGYLYLREGFFTILNYLETLVPEDGCLILLGHVKDKLIVENGKEITSVDLDLTGKISPLVCSKADAIALLYRKKNQTILTFKGGSDTTVGARPEHLKNQEIVVAEMNDEGKYVAYWDKIFV